MVLLDRSHHDCDHARIFAVCQTFMSCAEGGYATEDGSSRREYYRDRTRAFSVQHHTVRTCNGRLADAICPCLLCSGCDLASRSRLHRSTGGFSTAAPHFDLSDTVDDPIAGSPPSAFRLLGHFLRLWYPILPGCHCRKPTSGCGLVVPLGGAGLLLSVLEGFVLHLVPARLLLGISGLGALGSQLLLEFIPGGHANYWDWIFPATIFSTIGIDLSVILMTVFITTTFSLTQQGLAGGVLNSVLQLGVALTLD